MPPAWTLNFLNHDRAIPRSPPGWFLLVYTYFSVFLGLLAPQLSSSLRTLYAFAHHMSCHLPNLRHILDAAAQALTLSASVSDTLLVAGDFGERVCVWLDYLVYVAIGVPGICILVPILGLAIVMTWVFEPILVVRSKKLIGPLPRAESGPLSPANNGHTNPSTAQNPRPAQAFRSAQPSAPSGATRRTAHTSVPPLHPTSARHVDPRSPPPPYTP